MNKVILYVGLGLISVMLILVFTKTIDIDKFLASAGTLVGVLGALQALVSEKKVKVEKTKRLEAEKQLQEQIAEKISIENSLLNK